MLSGSCSRNTEIGDITAIISINLGKKISFSKFLLKQILCLTVVIYNLKTVRKVITVNRNQSFKKLPRLHYNTPVKRFVMV